MKKEEPKKMKSILYNFRLTFTIVLIVNMLFLIERTVFDFFGFMYGMIIADVLKLIFIIIGLFGSYQYRVNYVVACIISALIWLGWNTFIICNYLNLGALNRYNPFILNLNTDRISWWFTNSITCVSSIWNFSNGTSWPSQTQTIEITTQTIPYIDNFINKYCLLPFYWIEIIHSSLLIFLSILTIIFGLLLANAFNDEDDTFDYIGGFDAPNIIHTFNNEQFIPNNGHIRLEPLYVDNNHQNHIINNNIFDTQTLRVK